MLKLVPQNTKINFLGGRKVAIALSLLLMIGSVALFFTRGLNYGIDFKGGISLHIETVEAVDTGKIRSLLGGLSLGDITVKEYGDTSQAMIRIEEQPGGEEGQKAAIDAVQSALTQAFPGIKYLQENIVGPVVSEELKQDGLMSVGFAVLAVLIYIWFRFEWQFGMGAVIALVHDILLTIGFFSITGLVFNLPIIAALLTIVGYSLNDTVVVYDRVRENIRRYRKMPMEELLNVSLNQTLSRTVMTSVTTLLALLALFFFGGEVIRGFTAAMIWGVVIGTYSSIFVASPVLLIFKVEREGMITGAEVEDSSAKFR